MNAIKMLKLLCNPMSTSGQFELELVNIWMTFIMQITLNYSTRMVLCEM